MDWHVKEELAGECAPTPFMECCPYVREILGAVPASKLRVRLMKLEAGGTCPARLSASPCADALRHAGSRASNEERAGSRPDP